MRSDISVVALFIRPVSCMSGQLQTLLSFSLLLCSSLLCYSFLPVIYILTALSFRFYHLCQTALFFSKSSLFVLFISRPSFVLSVPLLCLLRCSLPWWWIVVCRQRMSSCSAWWQVCVPCVIACVCYVCAHIAMAEDVPESSCPTKHICTQSPDVLCCGQASALHHRATLINYRTLQC